MAKQLLGKEVAAGLCARLSERTQALRTAGIAPVLAIVRVGENPSDLSYERGVCKRAQEVGVDVQLHALPEDTGRAALTELLQALNADRAVHGVLLFRPLPGALRADEEALVALLDPEKDVDGMTERSNAGVFMGKQLGFAPCTPEACMEILDYYGVDCAGKHAVIIGRSLVVGKPLAMLLLGRNATVTVCHSRTKDLPAVARQADILIAAVGRAEMIGADYIAPGATVLDVGINWSQSKGRLVGDVDYAQAEPLAEAITPVPGGVGAVTTPVLLRHVVEAAEKSKNREPSP